jgi:putative membrane protein
VRALVWLARAAVFFVLFAFALNNQHESTIRWFFGHAWRAPTVFIVLVAFALGCAFGMLSMVPAWWKHRRVARRTAPAAVPPPSAAAPLAEEPPGRTVATLPPAHPVLDPARLVDVPAPDGR